MNTTELNNVDNVLERLHQDARKDFMRIGRGLVRSIIGPMQPKDFEHVYMPITKQQGAFFQKLIADHDCKRIVEFGTSFGISTIYLADAASQIGGKVITTELLESKAKKASQNIEAAGLGDFVEVRIGDAMKTLSEHSEPIDFLFLDGWKDLYLPLFKLLEGQFHSGTLIYADNMDMSGTRFYAKYVLNNTGTYATRKVDKGKGFLTVVI